MDTVLNYYLVFNLSLLPYQLLCLVGLLRKWHRLILMALRAVTVIFNILNNKR